MSTFTKLYVIPWLFLITVELIGVFWNFHDLDTMSGSYAYIRARAWYIDILLTVGLIALWFHLVKPMEYFKQWTS